MLQPTISEFFMNLITSAYIMVMVWPAIIITSVTLLAYLVLRWRFGKQLSCYESLKRESREDKLAIERLMKEKDQVLDENKSLLQDRDARERETKERQEQHEQHVQKVTRHFETAENELKYQIERLRQEKELCQKNVDTSQQELKRQREEDYEQRKKLYNEYVQRNEDSKQSCARQLEAMEESKRLLRDNYQQELLRFQQVADERNRAKQLVDCLTRRESSLEREQKNKCQVLQQIIDETDRKLTEATLKNLDLDEQVRRLTSRTKALEGVDKKYSKEIEELKAFLEFSLSQFDSCKESLSLKCEKLEENLDWTKRNALKHERKLDQARQLEATLHQTEIDLATSKNKARDLESQLDQTKKQVEQLEATLHQTEIDLATSENKARDLKSELNQTKHDFGYYYNWYLQTTTAAQEKSTIVNVDQPR